MENLQDFASKHDVPSQTPVENLQSSERFVSVNNEPLQEDVKSKTLDVTQNIVIPADCFTAVSMPKNWSQVERLKQQRLMLHQQLFSHKLNVKNHENHSEVLEENTKKVAENQNLKTFESNNVLRNGDSLPTLKKEKSLDNRYMYSANAVFDEDTDSSSSDDDMPRLQIVESYTSLESENIYNTDTQGKDSKSDSNLTQTDGVTENRNEKMDLGGQVTFPGYTEMEEEFDEYESSSQNSLNSSDLGDISASKINQALHNAIFSASDNKKHEESRIKQVLYSLKMKAEEKENEHLGYKISKPLATTPRLPSSSSGVSLVSNRNFNIIETYPESNLKVARNCSNIADLNPTKYVGLPVNVDNLSKQHFDYSKRNEDSSSLELKQIQTPMLESANGNGKTAEHLSELNFRNIALQKLLAKQRLGIKRNVTEGQNEVQENCVSSEKKDSVNAQKTQSLTISNGVDSGGKKYIEIEKTVASQIVSNDHTIPKQRKLLEKQKELCCLKLEILNKRIQAKSSESSVLNENMLIVEQKRNEAKAKKEVLKAELKLKEHELKMAENGIFLPRIRTWRYNPCSDRDGEEILDSEEEMNKKGIDGFKVGNKNKLDESEGGAGNNKKETENQLTQTTAVTENGAKQINSESDKAESENITKSPRNQSDSILREFLNSGKEMVSNLQQSVLEKQALYKERKLNVRSKRKRTVKSQNSLTAETEAGKNSKADKKCSPAQVNDKNTGEFETKFSFVSSPITTAGSLAQNGPSSVNPPQCLASAVLTSSNYMSKENIPMKAVTSTHLNASTPAQKVVIPQATILQSSFKNEHAKMQGVQRQSSSNCQPNRTEKYILPSGFVKDESTNQMFHTYRFNGHTFAMIDNKLFQIHLKSTDGKTKTVIGALIPTTASVSTARPGMVTAEPASNSSALLNTTAACSAISTSEFSSSDTTVGTAAKVSQKPVAYRFPVNIVPPASKPSQSLNLLILGTSPSSAATQSTQVIRKPLMHAVGGNNFVRAQLQQTLGQKVSTTSPRFASGLGTNIVRLPVTFTYTTGFQAGNSTSIPLTLGSLSVTQPVIQNQRNLQKSPIRSHMINTGSQSTKYQTVSPRTAKSLLTNKTYVMMDTSPVQSAKVNVQSPRSIEYCGSVVLSSASNQKPSVVQKQLNFSNMGRQVNVLNSKSEGKTTEVSVSNTVASNTIGTSGQGLSVHAADISNNKIILEKTVEAENETMVEKRSKENSNQDISVRDCSKYALRPKSPAKICSSMDSFIYTAKRKRKGTPLKKAQVETSSIQSQLQKTDDSQSLVQTNTFTQEKSQDQKALVDENKTLHQKITEPVPFLDFPARIVSTSKSGCSKKLSEIVASPNDKVKSGQNSDTSLDEEKMAKMINFASMLEEETNEKGAVTEQPKRKRLFKKRQTADKKIQELNSNNISSTDSEQETCKSVDIAENDKQQHIEKDMVNLNKSEEKRPENKYDLMEGSEEQSTVSVSVNKSIEQHEDRNMFNKLEQLVSKQNSLSESCNESNDSYDSSDLETYEKFVSSRKATSDTMKPKSQLIESYYTSQGMKEMKRCNIEPKHSFPLAGSYVTSESSPKIAELEAVSSESSPKKAELEAGELNTQKKTTPTEPNSLNSKSSSLIPEIRQDTGLVNEKCCAQSDMALHSKPGVTQNTNLTESNQKSYTVGGKQVKRLIKTKFIILKGDICDRWFEIKQKTGFGEMSDPKFIHYLLRLEEERQTKMNQINEAQVQTDSSGQVQFNDTVSEQSREINSSATVGSFSVDSGSRNGAVDLNNNNNAESGADEKVVVSDMEDLEDTIVNVTDTPQSSPGLSAASTPEIFFQTCTRNTGFFQSDKLPETTTSVISSQEKLYDEETEIPHGMEAKAAEKAPVLPDHSRKRPAEEKDVTEAPAAKRQFTFLSGTTQRQMLWAVSLFREWLKEKGEEDTHIEYRDAAWLNDKLARFYTDALSHEGTPYSTNILQTFRRSLSLYLASNSNSRNVRISISQDPEYTKSNEVLTDLILTETRQNTVTLSTVTDNVSYPINEDDMEKLYSTRTLSDDDPTCLMWKVWFDITFHLCKGKLPRNFWRSLTKRSLVLESDVNGVFYTFADYVYIPPDEQPGRMYATPNEPEKCPVRSTSFYLSKLCANCDALFQCSKRSWHTLQERWYLPVPVSREKLDKIMSKISEHAQLSRVYDVSCVILTAKLRGIKKE